MLASILSMTFPLEHFISLVRYLSPYLYQLVPWKRLVMQNRMFLETYVDPVMEVLATSQSVWTLFTGQFMGNSYAMTVFAILDTGKVRDKYWTTPDWVNMPVWEHKRRYNFFNYYKHLADCRRCEEQRRLLTQLADTAPDNVLALALYTQHVYPPPPPPEAQWWDPMRQPLIVELGSLQMAVYPCREDDNDCEEHEFPTDKEFYAMLKEFGDEDDDDDEEDSGDDEDGDDEDGVADGDDEYETAAQAESTQDEL